MLLFLVAASQEQVAGLSARVPESQERHDAAESVQADQQLDDAAHLPAHQQRRHGEQDDKDDRHHGERHPYLAPQPREHQLPDGSATAATDIEPQERHW